jgi:hypothetical protein
MARTKTLGGWVVAHHGMRAWWHVQRIIVATGLAATVLNRRPIADEIIGPGCKRATYYRDLKVFREVFPELEPFDVWTRLLRSREAKGLAVTDVVMRAGWSM